jgi:DNA-binding HxlR family transcriptional regulator
MVDDDLRVIAMLERRHALKILLLLLWGGPFSKREIMAELGVGTNVPIARINELRDAGLIKEEIEPVWPHAHILQLSDRGQRIALLAEKMIDILERRL